MWLHLIWYGIAIYIYIVSSQYNLCTVVAGDNVGLELGLVSNKLGLLMLKSGIQSTFISSMWLKLNARGKLFWQ